MKLKYLIPNLIISAMIILLYSDLAIATEYATFESFYKEPIFTSLTGAALNALAASAVVGASVYFLGPVVAVFTPGIVSSTVTGIGTWVGGLLGVHGAAATNAGLAFFGGGSIAAGGLGMKGGIMVLQFALTFSTTIVKDLGTGLLINNYSYYNLAEQSKSMLTLPLPINETGTETYQQAVTTLKSINQETPLSSDDNQQVIMSTIGYLESKLANYNTEDNMKVNVLLALLYFVSNDYAAAKRNAEVAIQIARTLKIKRTLPAFIYATSSLYEEDIDFNSITDDFLKYSILAEPSNPLTTLLFAIYLDRMLLRFDDNVLDESSLQRVFSIMQQPELSSSRLQNYIIILLRYFTRLKLEQQKISSLATTTNDAIKNSSKTLSVVAKSFANYESLLNGSSIIMKDVSLLNLSDVDKTKVIQLANLLSKYNDDKNRLASIFFELDYHQNGKWAVARWSGSRLLDASIFIVKTAILIVGGTIFLIIGGITYLITK